MKKLQRQYERKLKVNHNNDVFTTFQKQSQAHYSPYPQPKSHKHQPAHSSQHQHIQMLKSTLKSLTPLPSMEMTKPIDHMTCSAFGSAESQENQKYNLKLDQLSKNLQEIASKCHFSTQTKQTKNKSHANSQNWKPSHESKQLENRQKSYTLSPYQQPYRTQLYRNLNAISSNFPVSKSHSFARKEESRSHSKNSSQNRSSQQMQKSSKEKKKGSEILIWEGKSEFKNSSSKSFSKKEMLADPMGKQHSKNLAKIFDTYDSNSVEFTKRKRALTQVLPNQLLLHKQIHRSKITSILVSDSIYTASLDYNIAKISEGDNQWRNEVLQTFRGGVEHLGMVGDRLFASGRDCYIRAVNGTFFHKFESVPVRFYESERQSQINIGFLSNEVKLFDIQKRAVVSHLRLGIKSQIISKEDKSFYVGGGGKLSAVDWNKKQPIVELFNHDGQAEGNWLSNYQSKAFAVQNQGQITFLDNSFKIYRSDQLPKDTYFRTYDWDVNGLNLLALSAQTKQAKLLRYYDHKARQQLDLESDGQSISLLKVTQNRIIYCRKSGKITIKAYTA